MTGTYPRLNERKSKYFYLRALILCYKHKQLVIFMQYCN